MRKEVWTKQQSSPALTVPAKLQYTKTTVDLGVDRVYIEIAERI